MLFLKLNANILQIMPYVPKLRIWLRKNESMKKYLVALGLMLAGSGCATSSDGVMKTATNSSPFDAAFVFAVAADELMGCPANVARNLEIDRPADACEQKGIPKFEARIQEPRE